MRDCLADCMDAELLLLDSENVLTKTKNTNLVVFFFNKV